MSVQSFLLLSKLLLVLLLAVFSWAIYDTLHPPILVCGTTAGFCGTSDYYGIGSDSTLAHGKALFRTNCASCHAGDMKSKLTGPPLGPAIEAWEAYPAEELYAFIRNSQASIAKEHPRALAVWSDWQPTIMTSFPYLSDVDIEAILQYAAVIGHYKRRPHSKAKHPLSHEEIAGATQSLMD